MHIVIMKYNFSYLEIKYLVILPILIRNSLATTHNCLEIITHINHKKMALQPPITPYQPHRNDLAITHKTLTTIWKCPENNSTP